LFEGRRDDLQALTADNTEIARGDDTVSVKTAPPLYADQRQPTRSAGLSLTALDASAPARAAGTTLYVGCRRGAASRARRDETVSVRRTSTGMPKMLSGVGAMAMGKHLFHGVRRRLPMSP
jgi:hypothetical protein